jgi:hypothetical protein
MRVIHGPASDSVVLGVTLVDHVVVTVRTLNKASTQKLLKNDGCRLITVHADFDLSCSIFC